MADDLQTLADLAKINDKNLADIEVTDLLQRAPFIAALGADESSNGTSHKYIKETGAPVVGFRNPNEGRDHDKSEDTVVTIDLKILDASFTVDKAFADAYYRGPEAFLDRGGMKHLKAAYFKAEQQFINGTAAAGGDATGFTGLLNALNSLAIETVTGAGGTTNLTSVYFVRTNNDGADAMAIGGGSQAGDGVNIEWGESVVQFDYDSSGRKFPAYMTPIYAWLGLQIGGKYSVGRLCNVTAGDGHAAGTLTDKEIYRALETMPFDPDMIVMNRRSQRQLQQSRTATNATGAPAPRPTEVEGIPIVKVESIGNDEAAVT